MNSVSSSCELRCDFDVDRCGFAFFRVDLRVVGHFLTFVQAAQAGFFNSGDVDEYVCAAIVRLNKAIAFFAC